MENKKYTFKQIANYFIKKSFENKTPISKSRLHKLMYYTKGFYYVFENEELFENSFISSKNGPKLKDLSLILKKYENLITENDFLTEKEIKNPFILKFLDFIFEKLNKFDDKKLEELSLEDEPIKITEISLKINEEQISKYFREIYLNNDSLKGNLQIPEEEIILMFNYKTLIKYEKAMKVLAQWN